MQRYLSFSFAIHVALAALILIVGSLRSKPPMSYYSVDLFTSMPSGGSVAPVAPKETPAPVAPPPIPQPVAAPKEAIRIPDKHLKPKKVEQRVEPVEKKVVEPPKKAVVKKSLSDLMYGDSPKESTGRTTGGSSTGSASIVAQAGPSFPFPWYLKAVSDRIDKQWKPSSEYTSDVMCQIVFTISRTGQISEQKIEKSSSDSYFDQLALRAVLYSNPLPPLPNGYPSETLRVHLKFVGKEN